MECRGDPEPGGKAERPGTAQRLNGDPQDLIRAIPAKGDRPAGHFFDRPTIGHGPALPEGNQVRGAGARGGCRTGIGSVRSLRNAFCRTISGTACGWYRGQADRAGDPFHFQGCGTVTCSSRSQLAPDSSRPSGQGDPRRVHADAERCCLGHEQLAQLHPQLAKVAANSPGPAAAPAGRLPRAHPAPGPHRLLPARLTGKRRRGAFAFTPEDFRHHGPILRPG